MSSDSLTQAQLKQHLHYNPDTGAFTRRKTYGRWKAGTCAGTPHNGGYVSISIGRTQYLAHRLAVLYMTGVFPSHDTDHENHIRNDNRWENIRSVSRATNSCNAKKNKRNKSGALGVCWDAHRGKWQVHIGTKFGGRFKSKQEAITKRKALEREHKYHANHGI